MLSIYVSNLKQHLTAAAAAAAATTKRGLTETATTGTAAATTVEYNSSICPERRVTGDFGCSQERRGSSFAFELPPLPLLTRVIHSNCSSRSSRVLLRFPGRETRSVPIKSSSISLLAVNLGVWNPRQRRRCRRSGTECHLDGIDLLFFARLLFPLSACIYPERKVLVASSSGGVKAAA